MVTNPRKLLWYSDWHILTAPIKLFDLKTKAELLRYKFCILIALGDKYPTFMVEAGG